MHKALLTFLLLLALTSLDAQQTAPAAMRIPLGQVVEKMVSQADPAMSYALYLPAAYTADRKWPLLIAMDPRGRAMIPMDLYRETAEKLGYIVVSSYNTQSDAAWAPNVQAMKAIFADIPNLFSIDDRRIYLSGFSGTAMGGWSFANNLSPHVAGLINFCGSGYEWSKPMKGAVYSFFGASGTRDFNYEDVRALDQTLENLGIPRRIIFFDGEHEWGSKEVCSEGLEWMELQAMKKNLRPPDRKWIDEQFAARMKVVQSLEDSGDPFQAYRGYQSIERDFSGLEPVEPASAKTKSLAGAKVIKETMRKMDHLAEDQSAFIQKLFAFFNEVHSPTEPGAEINRMGALQIPSLQKHASDTKDRLKAQWAQRMMEIAFVQSSFYVPRTYLESKDASRTLKVLSLADRIKPDHPRIFYMKARAAVVANDEEKAVQYLSKFVELNPIPAETLANDPNFVSLQKNPQFQRLLNKLRSS